MAKKTIDDTVEALQSVVEQWVEEWDSIGNHDNMFAQAKRWSMRVKRPTVAQVDAVMKKNLRRLPVRGVGNEYGDLIFPALYRRCKEKVQVYRGGRHRIPRRLAWRLPRDTTFIQTSNVRFPGTEALGTVISYVDNERACSGLRGVGINYGIAGNFGEYADGLIINAGTIKNMWCPDRNIVINFGSLNRSQNIFWDRGRQCLVINAGRFSLNGYADCKGAVIALEEVEGFSRKNADEAHLYLSPRECQKMTELKEYVERLRTWVDQGSNNYQKALELPKRLGVVSFQELQIKVEKDLEGILRRAGKRFSFKKLWSNR